MDCILRAKGLVCCSVGKRLIEGRKMGYGLSFLVFDKKCIVFWMIMMLSGPSCVGVFQTVLFPFYSHEDFEEGFEHPSTLG